MLIRITRVYTRTGDKGTTALVDGKRVPKALMDRCQKELELLSGNEQMVTPSGSCAAGSQAAAALRLPSC